MFVTGRNKAVIEDHFDIQPELRETLASRSKQDMLDILDRTQPEAGTTSFTRQQAPLGLGHAVWCARDIVGDEPFALLLPDMVMQANKGCLSTMMDVYKHSGGNIIAVQECNPDEVSSYGIIAKGGEIEGGFEITDMIEKPAKKDAPSNLYINGRYILQPEIFKSAGKQETGCGR